MCTRNPDDPAILFGKWKDKHQRRDINKSHEFQSQAHTIAWAEGELIDWSCILKQWHFWRKEKGR